LPWISVLQVLRETERQREKKRKRERERERERERDAIMWNGRLPS